MSRVGLKYRVLDGCQWFREGTVVTCIKDDGSSMAYYRGFHHAERAERSDVMDLYVEDEYLEEIKR